MVDDNTQDIDFTKEILAEIMICLNIFIAGTIIKNKDWLDDFANNPDNFKKFDEQKQSLIYMAAASLLYEYVISMVTYLYKVCDTTWVGFDNMEMPLFTNI